MAKDDIDSQLKDPFELYGPPQESEYDTWSPEKVAQYDSALREFEGAQAFVKGGSFYGQKFLPLAKVVAAKYAKMDPDTRDRSLNELARFRAWKQGRPIQVYGPPAPEFSDARMPPVLPEDAVERAADMTGLTPEQAKAKVRAISEENEVLGLLSYFTPVRDWLEQGRRQLTDYELEKSGVPSSQIERIKKKRGK